MLETFAHSTSPRARRPLLKLKLQSLACRSAMGVPAARQHAVAAVFFFDSQRTAYSESYALRSIRRCTPQRCKIGGGAILPIIPVPRLRACTFVERAGNLL